MSEVNLERVSKKALLEAIAFLQKRLDALEIRAARLETDLLIHMAQDNNRRWQHEQQTNSWWPF